MVPSAGRPRNDGLAPQPQLCYKLFPRPLRVLALDRAACSAVTPRQDGALHAARLKMIFFFGEPACSKLEHDAYREVSQYPFLVELRLFNRPRIQ